METLEEFRVDFGSQGTPIAFRVRAVWEDVDIVDQDVVECSELHHIGHKK
jgi:hypothetical protein